MNLERWAVQGVILNDDGTESGRYTECRFLTRWAARRFQRSLRRDNHYPFRAELWRLTAAERKASPVTQSLAAPDAAPLDEDRYRNVIAENAHPFLRPALDAAEAAACPKCGSTDTEPRNPTIGFAPLGKALTCRACGRFTAETVR